MVPAARQFRSTFCTKACGAAALVALADLLFLDHEPRWTLGGFAMAWTAVVGLVRRDVRRSRAARIALLLAGLFGAAMIDDPDLLDWSLFWTAIASAALLPRRRFRQAIAWAGDLLLYAVIGLAAPFGDVRRWMRTRRRAGGTRCGEFAGVIALPVIGGGVFVALFAAANPLIGDALGAVRLPGMGTAMMHLFCWWLVLLAVWPSLRPNRTVRTRKVVAMRGAGITIPIATLILSLVTFNAIFAIENALDLAFLWSGAPLPEGVTLADYAHRGAYPLIVTALLAGGFVLLAAQPGSAAAASPLVRRLIVLWTAQNLLLVASSIRRTLDYVAAYSLTEWRIAALAWMGLVATGLILIVWRLWFARTAGWLINANALAAGAVLIVAAVADLGAIAATWNVEHAHRGEDLDLCYLERLGSSALLPLIELERRAGGPVLRDRATFLRTKAMNDLADDQADWHRWTARGARRLATAQARLGGTAIPVGKTPFGRACGGAPLAPPPSETGAPGVDPLTNGSKP